jgi:adenylate kinase
MKLKHILVILGPPGSGKGTQGKLIAPILNYGYLSVGQFLREYSKKDTELARTIKEIIDAGKILPDSIFIQVFGEILQKIKDEEGVVFDGFPRDMDQVPLLEEMIRDLGIADVKVLFIDVPKEKLIERITHREIEGRADDDPKVIATRFDEYQKKSEPINKYFDKQGELVRINGDQGIEEVHNEIKSKLGIQ